MLYMLRVVGMRKNTNVLQKAERERAGVGGLCGNLLWVHGGALMTISNFETLYTNEQLSGNITTRVDRGTLNAWLCAHFKPLKTAERCYAATANATPAQCDEWIVLAMLLCCRCCVYKYRIVYAERA